MTKAQETLDKLLACRGSVSWGFGERMKPTEIDAIADALRLAAQADAPGGQPQSPPARDEIANAIRGALVENWKEDLGAKWDEDVLLTGCRRVGGGRGYHKPEEAAQNLALDAADAVLALSRPDRNTNPSAPGASAPVQRLPE
jgi:hypothetical protein